MRYQIFMPLVLLQALNLFWYFLIWRVAFRYVMRPTIVVPELTYVHFVGLLATSASQTCGRTTKMMAMSLSRKVMVKENGMMRKKSAKERRSKKRTMMPKRTTAAKMKLLVLRPKNGRCRKRVDTDNVGDFLGQDLL